MPLTFPFDLMASWPGWVTDFDIDFRQQHSRQANGVIRVGVLGQPLWRMAATTKLLRANEHRSIKAMMHSLEAGRNVFHGRDLAGCYPAAYQGVSFTDEGSIASLPEADQCTISGLPANFAIKRGDYFHVAHNALRSLHQAMEDITANGSGTTAAFEVRPYFPSWVTTTMAVRFRNAVCRMVIIPGTVMAPADPRSGKGTVSFQAIQTY